MHAAMGSKRARTDQAQEEPAPPPASAPPASTPVLEQQRALAQLRLSEMVEGARTENATAADLPQRVERLRVEGEQQRDLLQRLMASGDLGALAIAARRADELQKERERCEEQLATSQQRGQQRTQALAAVVAQQGVVADLLRLLVLQERVLAHDMSEEERLGVWSAQPEAGAAWERLSAELTDATASDPLASGWAEGERVPAAAAADEGLVDAAAAEADAEHSDFEHVEVAPEQAAVAPSPGYGGSGGGGGGGAGAGSGDLASAIDALFQQAQPFLRPLQGAGLPAQAGPGVTMLRWSTLAFKHPCALLVRDPRTGQEAERPYHQGMEQQLPERFKVKFVARTLLSEDPVAITAPGRAFLFLDPTHLHQRRTDPEQGVPPMQLLGVVEEAEFVEDVPDPQHLPRTWHLTVRRLRPGRADAAAANVLGQLEGGPGRQFRSTAVAVFGLGVREANRLDVTLDGKSPKSVLCLPAAPPRLPL